MCLEHEQQEHKFRFKNTNPEIKIQKLKISKSQCFEFEIFFV